MTSIQIYEIINSIITILPLIIVIYKLSGIIHTVKNQEKRITALEAKDSNMLTGVSDKMDKMSEAIVEVTTAVKFMQKDIIELKTDVKEHSKEHK